jgi:CopG family transcriptional regulator, nickel-responsive regulator
MMAKTAPVTRISMSMSADLLTELDHMVADRGFSSRSQVISEILYQALIDYRSEIGRDIVAGVITVFYDHATPGLQKKLADLQHKHIDEIISSLHVPLAHNQTMEVMLVQGPASKLHAIANEMTSRRGVISGKVNLMAALIPQVHPFTGKAPSTERRRR